MCTGIVEIWFGIANGQISVNSVICWQSNLPATLSFHVFFKAFMRCTDETFLTESS